MPRERRQNFRVEWTSPASVDPGDGRGWVSCIVKNLSNDGARIACPQALPDEFMLRLTPGRCRIRSCLVMWRRGEDIGVRFTDVPGEELAPAKRLIAEPVG